MAKDVPKKLVLLLFEHGAVEEVAKTEAASFREPRHFCRLGWLPCAVDTNIRKYLCALQRPQCEIQSQDLLVSD